MLVVYKEPITYYTQFFLYHSPMAHFQEVGLLVGKFKEDFISPEIFI